MVHRHEWRFAPNIEEVSPARTNTYGFYCTVSGCDEYILLPEVECRLQATECLSAEDARKLLSRFKLAELRPGWAGLEEYASALEGSDE